MDGRTDGRTQQVMEPRDKKKPSSVLITIHILPQNWPGGFNGYVEHSTFMLFVRMPQVLSKVEPAPAAWLIIFYTLAVVLGLHSLCIYVETVRKKEK